MMLTTHRLAPRLRMIGTMTLFPLHVRMAWKETSFPLYFQNAKYNSINMAVPHFPQTYYITDCVTVIYQTLI
jgi:hypothetical protein